MSNVRTALRSKSRPTKHIRAGPTTKLMNQVPCGPGIFAVAEATQVALNAGVDALRALLGGRADSARLQKYLPRIATKEFQRTSRIENRVKDLNALNDLARQTGTSMPMMALCSELHRLLTAMGLGDEDQAAVMEFLTGTRKVSVE